MLVVHNHTAMAEEEVLCKFCHANVTMDSCPFNLEGTAISFEPHRVTKPKCLGKGTYGHVYSPSIMSDQGIGYLFGVSKLYETRYEANIEAQLSGRVELFDPNGKFHLRIYEALLKPSPLWLCTLDINPEKKHMNIFECGDMTLMQVRFKQSESEFLPKLVNVLDGLETLHTNKFYHMDVKSLNIVEHRGILKLIDFGISMAFTTKGNPTNDRLLVYDDEFRGLDNLYGVEHIIWPHELPLLCAETVEKKTFSTYNAIKPLYQKNLWTDEYILAIHAELKLLTKRALVDLVLPTVDVFGFALMVLEVTNFKNTEATFDKWLKIIDEHDMVHPDPRKRPTLTMARDVFKAFVLTL